MTYSSFDFIIGEENMELFNGPVYLKTRENSPNSHQYFLSESFKSGNVVFKGQGYYGQNIRYNTFFDEIMITPKYNVSGLVVKLVKEYVTEFSIEGHQFIKLAALADSSEAEGYFEVLATDAGKKLLKKHRKKRNKSRSGDLVIIEYTEDADYYLWSDEQLVKASSISHWRKEFPENKKLINQVHKELQRTYRTDRDAFFQLLFTKIKTPEQL